jgi:AraC-like DNA-binding protein
MTPTILTTGDLAPQERETFWRQAMSETFVPLTVGEVSEDCFKGFIRANWIGRLMIAEVASTGQDIQRTQRLIRRADAEYFQLAIVAHGTGRVVQDGRQAVLHPGDCAAYETTRPFRWTFDDEWDAWVFTFPRQAVRLSEAERRLLTARRLDGTAGITGVVSRFLLDLGRNNEVLSGEQSEAVLAQSADLVMTLLSPMAGHNDAARSSVQRSLMFRIKDYIDRRLADPELSPPEIAAAASISTRYLHKLFSAEQQSVSEYIRQLRLDRCRQDLLDPCQADQSISSIAFRSGFGDLSGFTRAFRATFGVSPRDVRGHPHVAHAAGR